MALRSSVLCGLAMTTQTQNHVAFETMYHIISEQHPYSTKSFTDCVPDNIQSVDFQLRTTRDNIYIISGTTHKAVTVLCCEVMVNRPVFEWRLLIDNWSTGAERGTYIRIRTFESRYSWEIGLFRIT